MASKTERTRVEINESTTDGVRKFNITLTAPASDFALTDLLRQRGVIEALDAGLKQAVKEATANYLSNAESLIARLTTEPNPAQKSRSNGRKIGKDGKNERLSSAPQSEPQRTSASEPVASTATS
ncbi:MAG TPA: hypothetical protein VI306_04945 [Pyrinomonadaceae bacterium]